jgi:hypothetical protein
MSEQKVRELMAEDLDFTVRACVSRISDDRVGVREEDTSGYEGVVVGVSRP